MKQTNVASMPLGQELIDALEEKRVEAIELLQISSGDTPGHTVKKIRDRVSEILEQNQSEEELQEYALKLGALWGFMVIKEYGWTWQHLDFGENIKGIYLVSPNAYFCCPPLYFLNKILQGNNQGLDGNNDNTVLLLFNMLDGIEGQKPSQKYQVVT